MSTVTAVLAFCLLIILFPVNYCISHDHTGKLPQSDIDLLEFPLNLEFLEAEFFLWGALGYGLDVLAFGLSGGGPPPVGVKKAQLDPFTNDVILQFGLQEVGQLRAIKRTVKGFPRPLLNLSSEAFGEVMNSAFGRPLIPPFDPYANSVNYLLASYVVPYVGLTGYVGANPKLQSPVAKRFRLTSLEKQQWGISGRQDDDLSKLKMYSNNLTMFQAMSKFVRHPLNNNYNLSAVKALDLLIFLLVLAQVIWLCK